MDDHYFRQRFPDFQFTCLAQGISDTVKYYRKIL
jgi:hypothetical protein